MTPSPLYSGERAGERGDQASSAIGRLAPLPNPLPRVRGRGRKRRSSSVLINKDSRAWIVICLLLLGAAGVVYFAIPGVGQRRLDGPSGGTPEGVILGVVGVAMMLFALLLGPRERVRTLSR